MARINLLPWREERRQQRKIEFFVILGIAFGIGVLLWLGARWHIGNLQENQDERNQMLRNEIAILDRRIREIQDLERKRDRLLARKEVIEELQKNRSLIVHLFDQLVRTVPDGVRLAEVSQQGQRMSLDGFAESNAKVSDYMRRLDASAWIKDPQLDITEVADALPSERYRFTVRVTVGAEQQAADGSGIGAQGGTAGEERAP